MLYLDNGSEYSDPAMMRGFTELSKLTNGELRLFGVDRSTGIETRVDRGAEAVVRSRPSNAKGKLGIEGAFANLERNFLSRIEGWVAGDRMRKKTHAKGKDPLRSAARSASSWRNLVSRSTPTTTARNADT